MREDESAWGVTRSDPFDRLGMIDIGRHDRHRQPQCTAESDALVARAGTCADGVGAQARAQARAREGVRVKRSTSHPSFQCADTPKISSAGTPETIGQDQSAQGEHCSSQPRS